MTLRCAAILTGLALTLAPAHAQYIDAGGRLRVALVKQPFVPNGTSVGRQRWRAAGFRTR